MNSRQLQAFQLSLGYQKVHFGLVHPVCEVVCVCVCVCVCMCEETREKEII